MTTSGKSPAWAAEINLLEIIDRRYSHLLPTWMTINVANRKEAETRMGAPTVDRLAHDALTVVCDWPSFRAKKPDANGLQ
jgi:DNA replication protein DnaC